MYILGNLGTHLIKLDYTNIMNIILIKLNVGNVHTSLWLGVKLSMDTNDVLVLLNVKFVIIHRKILHLLNLYWKGCNHTFWYKKKIIF